MNLSIYKNMGQFHELCIFFPEKLDQAHQRIKVDCIHQNNKPP